MRTRVLALLSLGVLCHPGQAQANETIRYATDGYGIGALTIIAAEAGFLEREGIAPVVQTYAYGVDTVDAVLAGNADFGVVVDFALLPRLTTERLVSPAIIAEPQPGWHKLYVRGEIEAPAGLRGRKIGIAAATAQEFISRTYLSDNGISPDEDVSLLAFGSLFDLVGAMKAGRVDAAWIWGDGTDVMAADRGWKFVADDAVIGHTTGVLLVTSKDFYAGRRDWVVRTLRALQEACLYMAAHPAEAARQIADATGGDAGRIERTVSQQFYGLSFNEHAFAGIEAKYRFLVATGRIEPYDLPAQFDASALAEAVPGVAVAQALR